MQSVVSLHFGKRSIATVSKNRETNSRTEIKFIVQVSAKSNVYVVNRSLAYNVTRLQNFWTNIAYVNMIDRIKINQCRLPRQHHFGRIVTGIKRIEG